MQSEDWKSMLALVNRHRDSDDNALDGATIVRERLDLLGLYFDSKISSPALRW